jgi:hypothetical protein
LESGVKEETEVESDAKKLESGVKEETRDYSVSESDTHYQEIVFSKSRSRDAVGIATRFKQNPIKKSLKKNLFPQRCGNVSPLD